MKGVLKLLQIAALSTLAADLDMGIWGMFSQYWQRFRQVMVVVLQPSALLAGLGVFLSWKQSNAL